MAIDNLIDFMNNITALNKTNKRAFFNAFDAQRQDAFELTDEEKQAQYDAYMSRLRTLAGQLFGVSVPANVIVNQIKTFLNNWVDDKWDKLQPLVNDKISFKQQQLSEAEAAGNDVEAWLKQAVKISNIYKKVLE